MIRSFVPCAFALLLAASLRAEFSQDKAVVALKPDKNPDAMIEERTNLGDALAKALGKPVEVIVPNSGSVIQEGLANGTIDIAFVSGSELVNAREADAASLLLAVSKKSGITYQSYWLALKDKPYTSIKDLKGKPVAFASPTSTSGFVVPMYDLHQQGFISEAADPEEFFGAGNVWIGNGYVSAVERVLSGESEAAAVSDYVLLENKHLTDEQRAKLKKIDDQGPVPTHLLAVSSKRSEEDRAALKAAFESLNESGQHPLRDKVFGGELVVVDEKDHIAMLADAMAFIKKRK